jgi:hypothetical protein
MMRRTVRNVALALAGLVVAIGVGLAANAVSEDSIGLSAQPLEASESLAPARARQRPEKPPKPARKRSRHRRKTHRPPPPARPASPTPPAPPVAVAPAQQSHDKGGERRGRNRGSDDSDRDGDSSGSSSDDSGHSGSGDAGDGSDDSGGGSDDEQDDD